MTANSVKKQQPVHGEDTLRLTADIIKFAVLGLSVIFLILTAYCIFGSEFSEFFQWYMVVFACGISCMPVTLILLGNFRDSGWIFSKVIGIAVTGWFMWMLSSIKLLKFTPGACWVSVAVVFILNVVLYLFYGRKKKDTIRLLQKPGETVTSMLVGEIVFLLVFIFWTYLKGFKPEAYGTTEKLMDIGFMQAMFKSEYMPAEDMWLSGNPINYYYVGQFMATYLTKLSGVGVDYGYNLTLMLVAAFSFSLPCSIVSNAAALYTVKDGDSKRFRRRLTAFPYVAGGLAGAAVSFAGNFHYCLFNRIVPAVRSMLGLDQLAEDAGVTFSGYWFPDATRYIGYVPDTNDKTIHEFPLYSFVLGDLHAHVINIMFVLCVVAILLAFVNRKKEAFNSLETIVPVGKKQFWGMDVSEIFNPAVIAVGFFIGLFHTTNYWDYPIYFVVSGAIILFINCRLHDFSWLALKLTAAHAVVVLVISKLVCLPFTLSFKQIANSVRISENHTPLYQLAILWGIPVIIVCKYLFEQIDFQKQDGVFEENSDRPYAKKCKLFRFIGNLQLSDLFMLVLGLCAIGLVLIPELIYVKDIYSGAYKRANTMFKLTYQAYILFGMVMSYVLIKMLFFAEKRGKRIFAIVMLLLLVWTMGYFENSTTAWFGDYSIGTTLSKEVLEDEGMLTAMAVLAVASVIIGAVSYIYLIVSKRKSLLGLIISSCGCMMVFIASMYMWISIYAPSNKYQGLDAGEYLFDVNMSDYMATSWINENIEGRPVMLEANGESYTDYCRVSVRTGLPTLLGWQTHEWLWQSDASGAYPEIVSEREAAVKTIYCTEDAFEAKALIEKYDISYIYVGGCEREKFEDINYETLLSLGEVIYPGSTNINLLSDTFIIEIK